MTGMKEGAGEDPFADDKEQAEPTPDTNTNANANANANANTNTSEPTSAETESVERQRSDQQMQIPYKFRRDGVQDGRTRVPLFLQEETKRAEREALREFEDRFDENVSLTDLREALMKVGLQHPDDVATHLEEWGYGLTSSRG